MSITYRTSMESSNMKAFSRMVKFFILIKVPIAINTDSIPVTNIQHINMVDTNRWCIQLLQYHHNWRRVPLQISCNILILLPIFYMEQCIHTY